MLHESKFIKTIFQSSIYVEIAGLQFFILDVDVEGYNM